MERARFLRGLRPKALSSTLPSAPLPLARPSWSPPQPRAQRPSWTPPQPRARRATLSFARPRTASSFPTIHTTAAPKDTKRVSRQAQNGAQGSHGSQSATTSLAAPPRRTRRPQASRCRAAMSGQAQSTRSNMLCSATAWPRLISKCAHTPTGATLQSQEIARAIAHAPAAWRGRERPPGSV
eukprot:SAG11_NODE_14315_length_617_cov_0.891892_1_plen_182_part_00